jgi:thiamine-phosphate pyrophosphorylase
MSRERTVLPRLHVLTDPVGDRQSLDTVGAALSAGAGCIQVRVKTLNDRELLAFASEVVARCRAADAMCIVNDRVDIALASGADGAHLGAHDLPVTVARELAGDRLIIGGTARDPAMAVSLEAAGADYLGAGPIYVTTTKQGLPSPIGFDTLTAIVEAVSVPVIGISGVNATRVPEVLATGAHGVAVTAAITGTSDPAAATQELLDQLPRDAGPTAEEGGS